MQYLVNKVWHCMYPKITTNRIFGPSVSIRLALLKYFYLFRSLTSSANIIRLVLVSVQWALIFALISSNKINQLFQFLDAWEWLIECRFWILADGRPRSQCTPKHLQAYGDAELTRTLVAFSNTVNPGDCVCQPQGIVNPSSWSYSTKTSSSETTCHMALTHSAK